MSFYIQQSKHMIYDVVPLDNKDKALHKFTRGNKALLSVPIEHVHTMNAGVYYHLLHHYYYYYYYHHHHHHHHHPLSTAV